MQRRATGSARRHEIGSGCGPQWHRSGTGLERRAEIGLRRSLGVARGQVCTQFLAESLLLSALGGLGGVALGVAVTAGYAYSQTWPAAVPAWVSGGGIALTLAIGAIAGLYPAIRASRLSPTEALAVP